MDPLGYNITPNTFCFKNATHGIVLFFPHLVLQLPCAENIIRGNLWCFSLGFRIRLPPISSGKISPIIAIPSSRHIAITFGCLTIRLISRILGWLLATLALASAALCLGFWWNSFTTHSFLHLIRGPRIGGQLIIDFEVGDV